MTFVGRCHCGQVRSKFIDACCLIHYFLGLRILHKYNFVHRDISTGNILSVNGGGKLSDLEYCKKRDTSGTHEIRTVRFFLFTIVLTIDGVYYGTLDFMPIQVESLRYRFLPPVPRTEDNPPFHYNPLHDMESIWWIGSWILFCHRDKPIQSDVDLQAAQHQMQDVQLLFPRTLKSFNRFDKFSGQKDFQDGFNSLPTSFFTHAKQLEKVRVELLTRYVAAEADTKLNEAAFANIHADFMSLMEDAEAESQDLKLFPLNRILPPVRVVTL